MMPTETPPSIVYLNIDGPKDPTRATLTLAAAIAAKNVAPNERIIVALLGKGVQLIDPRKAKKIRVTGARTTRWKNIEEMIQTALKLNPPVEIHC
jgi:predicted peroxiredoxin